MLKEQLTSVQAVGSTNSPLFLGNKTEGDSKESSNKTLFRRSFFCRFRKKVELNDRGKEVDISNVVKKPRAEAFSLTDGDMSGYSISKSPLQLAFLSKYKSRFQLASL